MSKILILLSVLVSANAFAAEAKYFDKGHTEISKVEALRKLINDPKAEVYKCSQVEMTDKATLKNK